MPTTSQPMTMMTFKNTSRPMFLYITLTFIATLCSTTFHSASASSSLWTLPQGTTAVVTGGTKGIGHAVVTELAKLNCRVLTCSRNPTELQEKLQEWKDQGLDVQGIVADVSTPDGRAALLEAIGTTLCGPTGRLDILVNNVGTNIRRASVDYTDDEYQKILDTNLGSFFHLTRACHGFLTRNNNNKDGTTSSVVNIGSVAGVTCMKSGTPYAATKAAMNQVTGNWACEWGPDGIRVNCVTPWYINTPLASQVLQNKAFKK